MNKVEIARVILESNNLVFLTGAGVSTLSGIPDYRSMSGVYANVDNPEYLLSHTCLMKEPDKFYSFVKQLYHPKAKPNIIHQMMAKLEENKDNPEICRHSAKRPACGRSLVFLGAAPLPGLFI